MTRWNRQPRRNKPHVVRRGGLWCIVLNGQIQMFWPPAGPQPFQSQEAA